MTTQKYEYLIVIQCDSLGVMRARRDAERADRLARASTEAADRHVNHKAVRDTRIDRIHGISADLRSYQRRMNEAHKWLILWEKLELEQKPHKWAGVN